MRRKRLEEVEGIEVKAIKRREGVGKDREGAGGKGGQGGVGEVREKGRGGQGGGGEVREG